MKNLKHFFGILTLAVLFMMGSCTDEAINDLGQLDNQVELSGDNTEVSSRSNNCDLDAEELSFEITYEGLRGVVSEVQPAQLSGDGFIDFISSQPDCYSSEEEAKRFLAQVYSANAATLNHLYTDEIGDQEADQYLQATKEFYTAVEERFNEAPLLSLLDSTKEETIQEIVQTTFADVITEAFNVEDSERNIMPCSYNSCASESYPSKKWKLFGWKGNKVEVRRRSEGGWGSNVICGFEVSDFPGKRIIGTRSKIFSWEALMLGGLHGGSFPYNKCDEEVFVHRIPMLIVRLTKAIVSSNSETRREAILAVFRASCETEKSWVKDKVRARKKNGGC